MSMRKNRANNCTKSCKFKVHYMCKIHHGHFWPWMDILPSVESIADYAKCFKMMTHKIWVMSMTQKITLEKWSLKNLKIREFRVFYLFIKMSKLDKNESFIWFIAGQKWSFREKINSLGNRIWWLRTVIKYSNFKNYWWRHNLWRHDRNFSWTSSKKNYLETVYLGSIGYQNVKWSFRVKLQKAKLRSFEVKWIKTERAIKMVISEQGVNLIWIPIFDWL